MKVLILGGNSPRHKQWIRELGDTLGVAGHEVTLQNYLHWDTGDKNVAIDYEISQAAAAMRKQSDYVIIAKSVGTVIATLGIARGELHPSKCLLLGVPFGGIAGRMPEFTPSLSKLPSTVFIQNDNDPYGSAAGLSDILAAAHPANYQFVIVDNNDTHDYLNFGQIESFLQ